MKVRMRFVKAGTMKFIGHLDVMRYFQKAFRRAELDMIYSQGYSPHPLLSFAQPLGLGATSDGEYLDLQLASCKTSVEMIRQINEAMAPEIRVESFRKLPDNSKTSMALVAAADYLVSLKDGYEEDQINDLSEQFMKFLSNPTIRIKKKTKKGEEELDLRPGIYLAAFCSQEFAEKTGRPERLSVAQNYQNGQTLYLRLSAGSVLNIKPEQVLEAFLQTLGREYQPFAWQIHRIELYAAGEEEGTFVALEDLGEEIV